MNAEICPSWQSKTDKIVYTCFLLLWALSAVVNSPDNPLCSLSNQNFLFSQVWHLCWKVRARIAKSMRKFMWPKQEAYRLKCFKVLGSAWALQLLSPFIAFDFISELAVTGTHLQRDVYKETLWCWTKSIFRIQWSPRLAVLSQLISGGIILGFLMSQVSWNESTYLENFFYR